MALRRVLGVLVIIVVVVWISTDPAGAAHSVRSWVGNVVTFFETLARG